MYSVYILDDESMMLKNMKNAVLWQENSFEVIGMHTNPRKAIDEIRTLRPDVVFTDLKMPILNGIEVVSQLQKHNIEAEFVMLSAFSEFEDARNFFLLNGFDYLLKPLQSGEIEMLLEKLGRLLSSREGIVSLEQSVESKSKNFDGLVLYLRENYNKKHTLASLSAQFHISPNYICNLFSKHYHATLTMFITDLRMREASRQIKETQLPFKEIAITCGYMDYVHFCKVFKNHFSVSPSQYRKQQQIIR